MQKFESIEDLQNCVRRGNVRIPEPITINEIEYQYQDSSTCSIEEMVSDYPNNKGVVVYGLSQKYNNIQRFNEQNEIDSRILMVWKTTDGLSIVPSDVFTVSDQYLSWPSEVHLREELMKIEKDVRNKVAAAKLASVEDDLETKKEINRLKRKEARIKTRLAMSKAKKEEEELHKIEESSRLQSTIDDRIAAAKLASAEDKLRLNKELNNLKRKLAHAQAHVKVKKASIEEEELRKRMHSINEPPPEQNEDTIGLKLQVVLVGFNGNEPLEAKVDTGADVSSLHATDIKIQEGSSLYGDENKFVTFTHGNKTYKMKVATVQAVSSSDGGTTYRPCVIFTMKVGEEAYDNVLFNLNDRDNMDSKILLGLNAIEKMDVQIDVTKESFTNPEYYDIDWNRVQYILEELF